VTTPATRDLREVVRAIQVVRDELRFQVGRIGAMTTPDGVKVAEMTDNELRYLQKLAADYNWASITLGKLYGYHMGRLEREELTGTSAPIGAVAHDGKVDAVTEEE
jgi:hypothetical protein